MSENPNTPVDTNAMLNAMSANLNAMSAALKTMSENSAMKESKETKDSKEKEVDLLDVAGKAASGIGRGAKGFLGGVKEFFNWLFLLFQWIGRKILQFLRFLKKNIWLFVALFILGLVTGYVRTTISKPFYETEMLVETRMVSRAQVADRFNNLQSIVKAGENNSLAQVLDINVRNIDSIFSINADIINVRVEMQTGNRRRDRNDTTLVEVVEEVGPQFLRVSVRSWSDRSVGNLGQALVEFIENDPHINERVEHARMINRLQQSAIREQIEKLTLFQEKNVLNEASTVTIATLNTPIVSQTEERTYVGEILSLQDQLINLQGAYELIKPIVVVQPFLPFGDPVSRMMRNLLIFSILFPAAAGAFIVSRNLWKVI